MPWLTLCLMPASGPGPAEERPRYWACMPSCSRSREVLRSSAESMLVSNASSEASMYTSPRSQSMLSSTSCRDSLGGGWLWASPGPDRGAEAQSAGPGSVVACRLRRLAVPLAAPLLCEGPRVGAEDGKADLGDGRVRSASGMGDMCVSWEGERVRARRRAGGIGLRRGGGAEGVAAGQGGAVGGDDRGDGMPVHTRGARRSSSSRVVVDSEVEERETAVAVLAVLEKLWSEAVADTRGGAERRAVGGSRTMWRAIVRSSSGGGGGGTRGAAAVDGGGWGAAVPGLGGRRTGQGRDVGWFVCCGWAGRQVSRWQVSRWPVSRWPWEGR